MRDAIHALKYGGLQAAARPLGRMLGQAVGRLRAEAPEEMLVVPVPLHRRKYAERGFNQARLLAVYALAEVRRTHPDWHLRLAPRTVLRLRATESQASLTPRQRRMNVRGAFKAVHAKAVASKHILVIDDIFTTGATARAVAQELRRAGAASVRIATLARARLYFTQNEKREAFSSRGATGKGPESRPGDPQDHGALSASMHSSPRQPSF
jgi:ComF family protein